MLGAVVVLVVAAAPKADQLHFTIGGSIDGKFVSIERDDYGCLVKFRPTRSGLKTYPADLVQQVATADGTIITIRAPRVKRPRKTAAKKETPLRPDARRSDQGGAAEKEPTKKRTRSFNAAVEGEYWRINDSNIPALRKPETPANEAALIRNLAFIVKPGSQVEVLDTKGIFSRWIQVRLGDGRTGWILGEAVKKAFLVKKGWVSPAD